MGEKFKVVLISHTHWDREWYYAFEKYRYRLVRSVDKLLDILRRRSDFHSFMMDGQVAPIDDYLEVRPERREEVERRVREGRLKIGPWYVQPDEFLVEGESIVRNLMLGIRRARELGGCMMVGYLPDTFGHTAQMPQILAKFGIDSFVFHRGMGTEFEELGTPFVWRAPDGSEVIALFLYGGYCNLARLSEDFDKSLELARELCERWRDRARASVIPGMIGCDHHMPKEFVPDFEGYARGIEGLPFEVAQGSLEDVIEACRERRESLGRYSGELLSSHYHWVLYGTWSSRVYLKQANFENEVLLAHYVEPLWVIAWLLGAQYPREAIWRAWRYVILSQPHDSICGCSVDEVHRECEVRQLKAKALAEELIRCTGEEINVLNYFLTAAGYEADMHAMPYVCSKLDLSFDPEAPLCLVAFNTLPWPRRAVVKLRIRENVGLSGEAYESLKRLTGLKPTEGVERLVRERGALELDLKRVHLRDPEGGVVPCQARQVYDGLIELLWVDELPAMGFKSYSVREGEAEVETDVRVGDGYVENEFLKVAFDLERGGAMAIEDKRTGVRYEGLNVFEDGGDVGDEYDYSPPERDEVVRSTSFKASMEIVERGPVVATVKLDIPMEVPESATPDRRGRSEEKVLMPVTCYVSLWSGIPRVDVKVVVRNTARDHRLRAVFPLGSRVAEHHAETHFYVIERPNETPYYYRRPDGSLARVRTYPMRSWVDLSDGSRGICVVTRGLHEYEVRDGEAGTEVAVTLMRCVGWLSRPDLLTRPGNAGPQVPTPGAQCLGEVAFEYSIIPHAGSWLSAGVHRAAREFVVPAVAQACVPHAGAVPHTLSVLSVEPREVMVSAVKKAEDDDSVVVRLFNVSGGEVSAKLRFDRCVERAWVVSLNEEPLRQVASEGGSLTVTMRPHEIVTVKAKLAASPS